MSEYYKRNSRPKVIPTPTGIKEKVIFGVKYEEDGSKKIVVKGMEDIYRKRQEAKESVDINNIIKRYTNGDPFALDKVKTTYGDFTNTPKDIVSAMAMIQERKEAFIRLPLEVREAYNHDPEQFIADAGSEKFKKIMKITTPEDIVIEKETTDE